MTATADAVTERETAGRPSFRGDVDGLRAVAIVIVVLFHAHVRGFDGGFVGVDVFFVISGFLITRNVLSEVDRTSTVSLSTFWAKRLRRLVPALVLVVTTTLVASYLVFPLIDIATIAKQGAAANFYVSNIYFALQSGDYFGGDLERSPFLHTWSLGVEEQFYVVWPLLLGAVVWTVRRRPQQLRRVLVAVFGVSAALSLALSVRLAQTESTWGFYGLQSRWWEFAVAGILAAVPVPDALRRRPIAEGAALVGLGLIALATFFYQSGGTYPGIKAVVPVLGTVLVIIGGEQLAGRGQGRVSGVLATAPMQWVGRVSYSWYLWHWPFMVLAAEVVADTVPVRVAAGAAALPVAAFTYRYYETPVRFSAVLTRSKARTFGAALAATVLVALGCVAITRAADAQMSGSDLDLVLQAARTDQRADPCVQREVTSGGATYCAGGDLTSDRVVLLTGDSHAGHWKTALLEVAEANGIRLVDRWSPSCAMIPVDTTDAGSEKGVRCRETRAELSQIIEAEDPDVVLLSQSGFYLNRLEVDGAQAPEAEAEAAWSAALREWLTSLQAQGIQPAVIFDNPGLVDDPIACVSERRSMEACAVDQATLPELQARTRAIEEPIVAELGPIPTFGTTGLICADGRCDVGRDGAMIYVDTGHLSKEFTRSLNPEVLAFLEAALAGSGGHFGD